MKPTPLSKNYLAQALLLTTLSMIALGVVLVASAAASLGLSGPWYARVEVRHAIFAAVAVVVLMTLWRVDYRLLGRGGRLPVAATLLLAGALVCGALVFIPGVGRSVGGHRRWIILFSGPFTLGFQPSEFIKFTLLIFLAAWLGRRSVKIRSFRGAFVPSVGVIAMGAGLIVTEDFGTAAIVGFSAAVAMFLAGVPWYYLATLAAPAGAGFYAFVYRDPVRWERITAMLNPWSHSNPGSYQPRQSLIAILSGGWYGKGLGRGLQKHGFLPEDTTDFIFSIMSEEWGYMGAVLLLGLFLLWMYLVCRVASGASDRFGRVLAASLGFVIALQAVLHIAVDQVVLPPTGVSLPFISAGGTALVACAAATALIVSVTAHKTEPEPGAA